MTSKDKINSIRQILSYTRRFLTPFVVFFVGLLTTAIVCGYVFTLARSRDALRFSSVTNLITLTLRDGINDYVQLAGSTASYLESNPDATNDEFKHYISILMQRYNIQGVHSIGFIENSTISYFFNAHGGQTSVNFSPSLEKELDTYIKQVQKHDLLYVSVPNTIVPKYFFLLLPVYSISVGNEQISRTKNIRGYVYIYGDEAKVVSRIVSSSLDSDILLEIRSEQKNSVAVLYKSDKTDTSRPSFLFPSMQTTRRVRVNEHDFYATFATKASFYRDSEINLLPYIIMIGTVVILVLYVLSMLQQYAWERAEKTAEELRVSERNVRIIEQQKTEFLNIASHELKTPITSLSAYIQLLERKMKQVDDLEIGLFIGRIKEQLNNLTSLINDLLDTTRIESDKMTLNKSSFAYPEFVQEVVDSIRPIIPNHTIIFAYSNKIVINADKFRIAQVLTNLLHNAAKYSPDADTIDVSLYQENNNAILAIKDYGIGISDQNIGKIFTKFFRTTAAKASKVEGLGLGLYISAEIVRKHKGDIWVESERGKGSVFSFSIPIDTKRS